MLFGFRKPGESILCSRRALDLHFLGLFSVEEVRV